MKLRRALKEVSPEENAAYWREQEKRWRDLWLRDHPGKTVKDYQRLSGDVLWDWRPAKGEASLAAERRAWERDHPGEEWQEQSAE